MFIKNQNIQTPNGNTIIWRYMELEKFLHLILNKQLFFSRLSKMTDKYEGTLPGELVKRRIIQIAQKNKADPFEAVAKEQREIEEFRNFTFINCWSINRNESYALWKIYLRGSNSGIAIKSTISKLRKSIESIKDNPDFFIGKVDYKNHFKEYPPDNFQLTLAKKPFYEFERELRVGYSYSPELEKETPILSQVSGYYIDIDISQLIEKIYISPFTGSWFYKSFNETIQKLNPELALLVTSSQIKDQ